MSLSIAPVRTRASAPAGASIGSSTAQLWSPSRAASVRVAFAEERRPAASQSATDFMPISRSTTSRDSGGNRHSC